MKNEKTIYWAATIIISAAMAASSFSYFTAAEMKETFVRLGFPDYFRIELGVAKGVGAIILVAPNVSSRFKEWTYFGFSVTFASAIIAHLSCNDPLSVTGKAVLLFGVLTVSYVYFRKRLGVESTR